jgi:urease accessory protein
MLSMLLAIWQADGAFPSGAFAFSYGIEGAVALRPGMIATDFERLVASVLRQRWASYDRIALLRAYRAGDDLSAIAAIDREVEASTLVEAPQRGVVSGRACAARPRSGQCPSRRRAVRRLSGPYRGDAGCGLVDAGAG